jgi:tetratricopeptide (TPR) repeat protein
MIQLHQSFVSWLNQPYLDLSNINKAALHVYGIEISYRNLVSNKPINEEPARHNIQVILPPSFRESLIKETGLSNYGIQNPLELANELRTERWNVLCDYLINYQELQPFVRLRVISLLKNLCFHRAVLEYVPKLPDSEIASDSISATIAFSRIISTLILQMESGTLQNLNELENFAHQTRLVSQVKLNAALQLTVQYAKTFRNLAAAEFWRTVATKELENIKSSVDDFTYNHLLSIYYRAVVFVPLLKKDRQKVIEEMECCEFYGETITPKDEIEQIVADENRNIILESRTKEALWLGDIDLAEKRARQLTQNDPLDPRYRLELGEILLKQNKIEEAAKVYGSAIHLGPPNTTIAWYMTGQCYEKLGELYLACDCYLACLQIDELAISALERLHNLALRLESLALANWSEIRLLELQELQKSMTNQPSISFIPEASSSLKVAGEKALSQLS